MVSINKKEPYPVDYLTYLKFKLLTFQSLFASIAGAISSFIFPVEPFLLAVIIMVVLDLVTGVLAASSRLRKFKTENEGLPVPKELEITSRGLFRTSVKMALYICVILGAHTINQIFFVNYFSFTTPIVWLVAFPIAWSELKSLDENMFTVTGISVWNNIKHLGKLKPGGSK